MKSIYFYILLLLLSCTEASDTNHSDHSSGAEKKSENSDSSYYTCSMHPQVKESKPGKCPICGMNLVKIEMDKAEQEKKINMSTETKDSHQHDKFYYTCSMHPQIRESKPGKCPICNMNLVKIELDEDDGQTEEASNTSSNDRWHCKDDPEITSAIQKDCPIDGTPMVPIDLKVLGEQIVGKVKLRKSQLSHFRPTYFPVSKRSLFRDIRLLGTVYSSEERESNIPARFPGRVEKVYVKSTGSLIKDGDPIVDIYSPNLITAGEEYILARRNFEKSKDQIYKDLYVQSEEKLKLWGVGSKQYNTWYNDGAVPKSVTVYSSVNGVVQKREALKGRYFTEGQSFFILSDLSSVWVEMDVYEQDVNLLHLGQKVNLMFTAIPGSVYHGAIDFISPTLDSKSRTLKVRTTIENKAGVIKPGMIAEATIHMEIAENALSVPRSAVIDTGKRKVVWVKISDSLFQAKVILTGYESNGYVEIKSGVMEGEEVVIDGNFLLDAQAQLFGGFEER